MPLSLTSFSLPAVESFKICLENDFIFLRGSSDETTGRVLQGTLVLNLRESIKVESIQLRLLGLFRIAWGEPKDANKWGSNAVDRKGRFHQSEWPPFLQNVTLPPGEHRYSFHRVIPGDIAESVEGLRRTGISYVLTATVKRGPLVKNSHASKVLRIIRTINEAALELGQSMGRDDVWPEKIQYSVFVPQKACAFGGWVTLVIRITPLLKDLDLGEIRVRMFETRELHLQRNVQAGWGEQNHKEEHEVDKWEFDINPSDFWKDDIGTGLEGWEIIKNLPLPKKLVECLQDCTVKGIKIRHGIKVAVVLKNPRGSASELQVTIPFSIYISPDRPLEIDVDGNLMVQNAHETAPLGDQPANLAPPSYGYHVLDPIYEGIDRSSILASAAPSGLSTPRMPLPRNDLYEDPARVGSPGGVSPAALSFRLQSVSADPAQRNTPARPYVSSGTATPHTQQHSRQSSQGNAAVSDYMSSINMQQLSRVPSYETALRTPPQRSDSHPVVGHLPSYAATTSTPVSPSRTPTTEHPVSTAEHHDPLATITEGYTLDS